jgi:hypothetical protein
MEMRMAKAMNILNLCHGGTKSTSSFVTPPEHMNNTAIVGPNKFTFPSIDAAVRSIPTAENSRDKNSSALNSKHSSSVVAVTSNSTSNNNTSNNNNYNKASYSTNFINHQHNGNGNKDKDSSNLILNQNYNVYNSTNADLASVDSSDTFMSCQTHPFLSQGDLTSAHDDDINNLCDFDLIDADNLYLNTMGSKMSGSGGGVLTRGASLHSGPVNIIVDSSLSASGHVKKSTSGDTALRSLAASPIDDQYSKIYSGDRGSRVSLNDTPVPKHRKTRFQQQQQQQQYLPNVGNSSNLNKPKTRFDDGNSEGEGEQASVNNNNSSSSSNNNNSSTSNKKNRRASFMPSKIITTATKQLINQHLFGLQSMGSKGT